MNADEADRVLASLSAAWPTMDISAATAMTWYDHLADIPVECGAEAARQIVASDRWFPSLARFREVALAERRRTEHANARDRGLPEPEWTDADRARNLEAVAKVRRQIEGNP